MKGMALACICLNFLYRRVVISKSELISNSIKQTTTTMINIIMLIMMITVIIIILMIIMIMIILIMTITSGICRTLQHCISECYIN